ncbi:methylamine utilization protein [Sphingomonas sp. ASV193]|uniref:methylamine utilization protein n=1 Tax=Sphingomonas sp. ASV193 TaxID=3144405 RepID=UPI0032E8C9E7
MKKLCILFALGSLTTVPASAGTLSVRVTDPSGKPVEGAVVIVRPVGRAAPAPRALGGLVVAQKGLQFHPLVSLVPLGSTVSFPNFDRVRHHVYSFSPAKRFELKLFASDQTRSVTFDKPGVVAIGCNIHDRMSAFLYVSDSAWSAVSGVAGVASIGGLPGGAVSVTVYHPWLRAPGNVAVQQLALSGGAQGLTVPIRLRPPPPMMMSGY